MRQRRTPALPFGPLSTSFFEAKLQTRHALLALTQIVEEVGDHHVALIANRPQASKVFLLAAIQIFRRSQRAHYRVVDPNRVRRRRGRRRLELFPLAGQEVGMVELAHDLLDEGGGLCVRKARLPWGRHYLLLDRLLLDRLLHLSRSFGFLGLESERWTLVGCLHRRGSLFVGLLTNRDVGGHDLGDRRLGHRLDLRGRVDLD